jgi:hypothetical protein
MMALQEEALEGDFAFQSATIDLPIMKHGYPL